MVSISSAFSVQSPKTKRQIMHAMVNEELLISVKYANTIHFSTISPLLNWKQLLLLSFVPS